MMDINKTKQIAEKYHEIMNILGITWTDDNKDTPERVAKSLIEMTENINKDPIIELEHKMTTFFNRSRGVELEQNGIEFSSMCSHHHLPFMGKVKVKYIPSQRIIGLSKFARIVEWFSKQPQVQEDLTADVGMFLTELLNPVYLEVEIYDTIHTCMCARGVRSNAETTTRYVWGERK